MYMRVVYTCIVPLVVFPVMWDSALAIDCFECHSFNKQDPDCGDPFHPAYGHYIKDCKQAKNGHIGKFPARYCIKLLGTTARDGIEMVFRGCSLETLDSQCGEFMFEDVKYKGCVMSCTENGCNHGRRVYASLTLLAILTLVYRALVS